jgi:uncharacterized protein YcbK (DUF882 family)
MSRVTLQGRRALLFAAATIAAPAILLPRRALATSAATRELAFAHTHTGERLAIVYAEGGAYVPDALTRLNRFLRDHYSGAVGTIDPALFDQLFALRRELGATRPFHVISGYRSSATNEALRRRGGGGVAKASLHTHGQAIDIRLPGVALTDLRNAALDLKAGGVGYYAASGFVHVDTGRPRSW